MKNIKKQYLIAENQNKIAVQIDISDFEKIEEILEDYGLGKLMEENDPEENLNLQDAKTYYDKVYS